MKNNLKKANTMCLFNYKKNHHMYYIVCSVHVFFTTLPIYNLSSSPQMFI